MKIFLYSSSVYSCHLFLISFLLLLGPYHFFSRSSGSSVPSSRSAGSLNKVSSSPQPLISQIHWPVVWWAEWPWTHQSPLFSPHLRNQPALLREWAREPVTCFHSLLLQRQSQQSLAWIPCLATYQFLLTKVSKNHRFRKNSKHQEASEGQNRHKLEC